MLGGSVAVPTFDLKRLDELRLSRRVLLVVEAVAFSTIFAIALAIRLHRLGTLPRIIAGDETDNLQVAYKIIEGTGPGIFGFDWKPAPIFSLYPLAWTIQVFGQGVEDFRLFPVILSLIVLALFYVVARESMGIPAALLSLAMLSTNLWFLHFSRTAWENANSAIFALGACWAITRALKTDALAWWAVTGIFTAFGLYGYFSGRFIFLSVALVAVIAIACKLAPWRRTLIGLALAGAVTAVLFAPMAMNIAQDWDHFNRRTTNASIFTAKPDAESQPDNMTGWPLAWFNVKANYQGLILQQADNQRGLWLRYIPPGRAPLEFLGTHLFWAGLIVAAVLRRRDTFAWWPFFVPLAISQIFSRGTPDLARAMVFAPFFFLFIGIAFDEAFHRLRTLPAQAAGVAAATALVVWVGVSEVNNYFAWQERPAIQEARLPGIDVCEFAEWRDMARAAAANGKTLTTPEVLQMRQRLRCSKIIVNAAFRQAP